MANSLLKFGIFGFYGWICLLSLTIRDSVTSIGGDSFKLSAITDVLMNTIVANTLGLSIGINQSFIGISGIQILRIEYPEPKP